MDNHKWVICRICLKSSPDVMIKIFDNEDTYLAKKIEECGGVQLNASLNLPDSICNKCFTLLRAATKFREKIQKSQAELNKAFLLQTFSDDQTYEILEKGTELSLASTITSEDLTQNKATNTEEIISIDDESANSNAEVLYSVEYADGKSEIVRLDTPPVINEADFSVLQNNDKLIDYVDQNMEDLELVFDDKSDQIINDFKIAPEELTKTKTVKEPKKFLPVRNQRKRKSTANNDTQFTYGSESTHICPFCGNCYAEKSKLSLHMKIHRKDKPHQCEICFKRFGQTPQLARHMNSHTGSRPFNCKFCSASFADPSTRIKHERIHTNERPYPCTICDKKFSYSNVLKVHMMTHSGEKPYGCKYCGKQFSQAHHKKKHERLHENPTKSTKNYKSDDVTAAELNSPATLSREK